VFDELMDEHDGDWDKLFKKFEQERVVNCNAIADLAIDNFHEMKDHVNDVAFMRKRKIEMQLEQQFPDYYSKYSLVTFRPELSYSQAMKRGRAQDKMLLELCGNPDFDQIPLSSYYEKLMNLELA
jgi:kynurenine 3-monooxygenase